MMKFGTKAPVSVVVVAGDSTEHRETRKRHVQNVDAWLWCLRVLRHDNKSKTACAYLSQSQRCPLWDVIMCSWALRASVNVEEVFFLYLFGAQGEFFFRFHFLCYLHEFIKWNKWWFDPRHRQRSHGKANTMDEGREKCRQKDRYS